MFEGIFFFRYFILFCARWRCRKRSNRLFNRHGGVRTLAVLYYVRRSNAEKYHRWEDGFTHAMRDYVAQNLRIDWLNLADVQPSREALSAYDAVLVKSGFQYIPDQYYRTHRPKDTLSIIAVSSFAPPCPLSILYDYDVVWAESRQQTASYLSSLLLHPHHFFAFGVNTSVFYPQNLPKDIDVLYIGAMEYRKRPWLINTLPGKVKVAVGDINHPQAKEILPRIDSSVRLIPYVSQAELARLINRSHLVFLPHLPWGGGERAMLEARLCGTQVMFDSKNDNLNAWSEVPLDSITPRHMADMFLKAIGMGKHRPPTAQE